MLEICGLTKRFSGIPVVENVSFTLKPGEILGYVGPNGAGKSTTVKMIIGLLEPSEGAACRRTGGCILFGLLFRFLCDSGVAGGAAERASGKSVPAGIGVCARRARRDVPAGGIL